MNPEVKVASAFFDTLLKTERSSEAEFDAHQGKLLTLLVQHALANVPFYKDRADPMQPVRRQFRLLEKPALHVAKGFDRSPTLICAPGTSPSEPGPISPVQTGGSTGPAARRDLSSLKSLARLVCSYRMFLAWELDQSKTLLRHTKAAASKIPDSSFDRWGHPWLPKETLGPRRRLDISLPAVEQLKVLANEAPVYVNTLPSNILRLVVEARRSGIAPQIPFHRFRCRISSSGSDRSATREVFGSRIINVLSSAEGGVIAIECPESGLFHIQSEQVLAEIIRKDGSACEEGEVGELVVTPLYSYATPLLRYRSGDYRRKGTQSVPAARSLPNHLPDPGPQGTHVSFSRWNPGVAARRSCQNH